MLVLRVAVPLLRGDPCAGLRVRDFTALPLNGFTWDVRGESPGLPNGMYILVVNTGSQVVRQRLMILSPAR